MGHFIEPAARSNFGDHTMGNFKKILAASSVLAGLAFAGSASAAVPSYPTPGTPNSAVYTFLSVGAGPITAYFVGSDAGDDENVGLFINGVSTGIVGLIDHGTPQGASIVLGTAASAGQVLTFVLYDPPTPPTPINNPTWTSDPTLNSDGLQHVYSVASALGEAYAGSPAGTYVAFEDRTGGDWDYNDDEFLFTGVTNAPEASTWAMMGLGFAGLGLVAFRRSRKTSVSMV
jgi:PEP-CTERM motif